MDAATGDDQRENLPNIQDPGFFLLGWFLASRNLFMPNPMARTGKSIFFYQGGSL
jgi:hypothetical protein